VSAVQLAEMVNRASPDNKEARDVLIAAHEVLLEHSSNFWESAWLRRQIAGLK
ncbi:MBL fold metallo-hydrolase, partial [Mycobacteroides abscessus subsp. massiliense]|nr:MBL fold metallo-hydrolase [Mycobacteroides abscessus subsp. massiliense]